LDSEGLDDSFETALERCYPGSQFLILPVLGILLGVRWRKARSKTLVFVFELSYPLLEIGKLSLSTISRVLSSYSVSVSPCFLSFL
jgi:hypothetical protein